MLVAMGRRATVPTAPSGTAHCHDRRTEPPVEVAIRVPGLAAEGETLEALVAKLHVLVPELLQLNRHLIESDPTDGLPIHVMAERIETVATRRYWPATRPN